MDECIAQFLNFLAVEKNASSNTIAAYRNDLGQFQKFAGAADGEKDAWAKIDGKKVVGFVEDLRERQYKDATVARKIAAVKSFFGFLAAEGLVPQDPTEQLKSPQVGKSLPRALSVKEVDELLEQPARRNTPEARRQLDPERQRCGAGDEIQHQQRAARPLQFQHVGDEEEE